MTDDRETTEAPHRPDAHRGGFRRDMAVTTERGGPRYGELIAQVRLLMDRVRGAEPGDSLVADMIGQLTAMNERLAAAEIDEWHAPSGTRSDLPARGNITLPPFEVLERSPAGVVASIRFSRFHLGGNDAVHGGYVCLAFDDLLGMTGALASDNVCRTAYLTVNYRSITPLGRDLTMRTRVERSERRKHFLAATLHDGDRLCAEADGLFISLLPGQP